MRLIALAAGLGTRLSPYTNNCNKCMIQVAGKPLLYHNLLQCKQAYPQFSEILIVVGYHKEQIMSYFGEDFMGIPIRYIHQHNLDGIAGAVSTATSFLIKEPFLLTLGDMFLTNSRLNKMVERFNKFHPDGLCGVVVDKPLEEMQDNYTLSFDESGRINYLIDKPKLPFNNYMGTGYFIFSPKTLEYVDKTPISPVNQQRGICDWIMLCVNAGLNFYPELVGDDAININDVKQLNRIQEKYKEGVV